MTGKKVARKMRFNVKRLSNDEVVNKFQIKIQNKCEALSNLTDESMDTEKEWNCFKDSINQVAEEELGFKKA